VSEGQYETMEDFRKAISDDILATKQRRARDELREKVISAVVEQAQITLHPVLIDEEAEEMLHQLTHMLERQQMSLDQYFLLTKKTREEYLQDVRPDAETRVRQQLVLDEVAREEKISVSPEELEAVYRAYAQAGQTLARSEEQIRSLLFSYRREKTITHLVDVIAGPDPDKSSEEELSSENAEAAAAVADALTSETDVVAEVEDASVPTEIAEATEATDTDDTSRDAQVAMPEETSNAEMGAQ
jgi:trigger factor